MSKHKRPGEILKNRVFQKFISLLDTSGTYKKTTLIIVTSTLLVLAILFLFFYIDKQGEPSNEGNPIKEMMVDEVTEKAPPPHDVKEQNMPFSWQDSIKTIKTAAQEMKTSNVEKQKVTVKVADKETLLLSIPRLKGWKPDASQYHKGAYGVHETANLNIVYKKPKVGEVFLEIIDYGYASAALQPLKMIFSMDNSTDNYRGYARVSEYNNIKVFEEYNKENKQAEFSFIVKKRYIIHLKSHGRNNTSLLKKFIEAFDFSKLD